MIYDFVGILIKNENSDCKRCDRHNRCIKHQFPTEELCWNRIAVKNTLSEKFNHRIKRIELDNIYYSSAFKSVHRIKDRHHIHKELCANIPNILDISEINIDYGKDKTDAR